MVQHLGRARHLPGSRARARATGPRLPRRRSSRPGRSFRCLRVVDERGTQPQHRRANALLRGCRADRLALLRSDAPSVRRNAASTNARHCSAKGRPSRRGAARCRSSGPRGRPVRARPHRILDRARISDLIYDDDGSGASQCRSRGCGRSSAATPTRSRGEWSKPVDRCQARGGLLRDVLGEPGVVSRCAARLRRTLALEPLDERGGRVRVSGRQAHRGAHRPETTHTAVLRPPGRNGIGAKTTSLTVIGPRVSNPEA